MSITASVLCGIAALEFEPEQYVAGASVALLGAIERRPMKAGKQAGRVHSTKRNLDAGRGVNQASILSLL